jgi:hypothetical protein
MFSAYRKCVMAAWPKAKGGFSKSFSPLAFKGFWQQSLTSVINLEFYLQLNGSLLVTAVSHLR